MPSAPFSELSPPARFDSRAPVVEIRVSCQPRRDWEIWIPEGLQTAAPERRRSAAAGRFAAHRALAALGVWNEGPLPRGARGEPVWPAGVVGSITHTAEFASAAVARGSVVRGLGIDSEAIGRAKDPLRLQGKVFRAEERTRIPGLETSSEDRAFALVFSAKESLYKALYPLVRKVFWFEAARVLRMDEGRFEIALEETLSDAFPTGHVLEGTYCESDGLVHTAVVVP